MLDSDLKQQLQAYLSNLRLPIELKAYLDSSSHSSEMDALLQEIAEMSSLIVYTKNTTANDKRIPSFDIVRTNTAHSINFAAIPMGHEFTSLVLALLHMGGHPPKIDESDKKAILQIETEQRYEVFMSLSCQNCPDVVQALNTMASINPKISVTTIDGALFQEEVEKKEIMAVPTVYRNGEILFQGRSSLTEILEFLNESSDADKQELYNAKDPFDVLIVGGGPAGAAAGIYAARKGIRTGILTDRFGGQVLDTLSIENYISVPETEGPRLAADLERHTKVYDVDIMKPVKASALKPGNGGHHQVVLDNGATLSAKTIILATGARWREMSVPGEQEYRNRGVAYCPHCDGPLFKGKKVSVIGGGNSGVEAAIDLAGIVEHVTLLEFAATLRADDVLQRKLRSLPNVTIITNAQTTEVLGNGQKVTGLKYTDRTANTTQEIMLDGIFVQIGLIPNTEWLKGVLALSKTGEIEIDMKGQTSVPGVFAAGDNTTVPYKQIIIAAGEGSKAALSAFDYLIRQNV